ncbi:MAG: Ig-like domain-containing protein [Piscinibacter sp.]|uniref:Ig-like domain-containing protein n=1 Tax=Piscinibacter sp. TaxID=1903157 RepID=UPI001B7B1CB6|nr:Ig-like domain-containing protein [Piscinibacter sp.]MBP5991137.1 Ig-like domain-containing protein [Piscinibacter sp.]MBP6028349.1 Ig-like domain-containing protein [Piscinibacter sp.]
MRGIKALLALSLTGLLAACGGGGSSTAEPDPAVAKVEIRETGALLTAAGANRQLSAVATDAQGRVVDVELTWSSSNAAAVAVDGKGQITAAAGTGSAQITAEAKGVRSTPLLVAVVTPPAGAMLLTDAQIVGDPVETDPNAAPSFANTYRVVLSGMVAPAVGQLLINTESKSVAGEVVAVDSSGGTHTVTLKLVSARVLFPNLNLSETFDLSRAPVEFPAELAAKYDITRIGNTFTFTPRPGAFDAATLRERALAATGTRALPPFTSCDTSMTFAGTPLPIALSAPPLFSITINPSLDVLYTPANGLERFVVQAEPVVRVEGGLNVTAAFEGKIDCKLELFVFRVPVGGALSLIVGGLVPVGVGLEAGGKITVATMGIGSKVEAKAKAQVGLACPNGANCEFVRSLGDFGLTYTPTVDLPSIGDIRVEPTLMAYGYVKAEIGNPFLRRIRFEAFTARAGGKLASSFAPMISQIADTGYKSDYKVSLEASAGVGADLEGALSLLGLSGVSALELTISNDIAKSPSATVTANQVTFRAGDTVRFNVHVDPASKDFFPGIGPYNIREVLLVRKNGLDTTVVGSATAAAPQTEFTIPFAATDFGSTSEFTAFVVTTLMPARLAALELGQPATVVLLEGDWLAVWTCVLDHPDDPPGSPCDWWYRLDVTPRAVTKNASGGFDPVPGLSVAVNGDACIAATGSGQTTDAQGRFAMSMAPASFAPSCYDGGKVHLVLSAEGGGTMFETDLKFDLED